ncbi:MAG: hypothetical protein GX962_16675 [Epulopiscium sp.]|nr:hypothetical protein [Candidatus Epulonipiscium sp.]
MKKSIIILTLVVLLLISTWSFGANGYDPIREYDKITAKQIYDRVYINGELKHVEIYLINGYNYIKLRDFAQLISGTDKQFNIKWDSKEKTIRLISNEAYSPVGGELKIGDGRDKVAYDSEPNLFYNEYSLYLAGYYIDGNNYFNLRELSALFSVNVSWDDEAKQIRLNTSLPEPTKESWVGRYRELYNVFEGTSIVVYPMANIHNVPMLELSEDGTFEYLLNFYSRMFTIKGNWEIDEKDSNLIHLSNYDKVRQKISFRRNNIDELELLTTDDYLTIQNSIGYTTNHSVYKRIR